MQRKDTPVGRGLGKTTGWTHRLTLGRRGVKMMNGVEYLKIDELGADWEPSVAEQLPLRVERISLADNWVFFLVLFLAAGLEWVFRRHAGLQ